MSEKDNGGPAFPQLKKDQWGNYHGSEGMTLRDYLAAKAMQGFAAAPDMAGTPVTDVARQAYSLADAMLAERAK